MHTDEIVRKTADHVKLLLSTESTGHDWWHTYRVWQMALRIGTEEKADLLVVQLACLLHDVDDWKTTREQTTQGKSTAHSWIASLNLDDELGDQTGDHILKIIETLSFKGTHNIQKMSSLEGMVVQDADRLDAIGAIGIARAFVFCGAKGHTLYNPEVKPVVGQPNEIFMKKSRGEMKDVTINHFYEKLLLLADLMNTKTGKNIALGRHKYMESFLAQFYDEVCGKK
jgi:uncharacterized protein